MPQQQQSVSVNDLLVLIGAKEVALTSANGTIAQLTARIAELETAAEVKSAKKKQP